MQLCDLDDRFRGVHPLAGREARPQHGGDPRPEPHRLDHRGGGALGASADSMRSQIRDYLEDAAKAKLEAEEAKRELARLRGELERLKGNAGV